jgi:hypothetical protein
MMTLSAPSNGVDLKIQAVESLLGKSRAPLPRLGIGQGSCTSRCRHVRLSDKRVKDTPYIERNPKMVKSTTPFPVIRQWYNNERVPASLVGSLLIAGTRRTIRGPPGFGMKDPDVISFRSRPGVKHLRGSQQSPAKELYQPTDSRHDIHGTLRL